MKARQEFKRNPLAVAWDEWIAGSEGQNCAADTAGGLYLRNRLNRAFMAGADAAKKLAEGRAGHESATTVE